ncbi:MAG: S41 family peptidase [Thermoguttaceae bacterium]|jgi:carboxyl-terminal processing protease
MLKILQFTIGVIAALFGCGLAYGNELESREQLWTPTSTRPVPSQSDTRPSARWDLPSLRALDPAQMRNVRAERAVPLQSFQIDEDADKIAQLLDEGDALMARRQWRDAKKSFEKGLRNYPDNSTLLSRFAEARRRQEIEVRYQDGAFTTLTANASVNDVLTVFDEVFQDVERYHVDRPEYSELFAFGVAGIAEALSEESFFIQNKLSLEDQQEAQRVFASLRDKTENIQFLTRDEVRRVALWMARQLRKYANVPETATLSEFLCSAICSLDAYSSPLTPMQVEDVFSLIDGRFVGIGVELKSDDPTRVVRVIPRSPAEESGVVVGDEIVAVDGVMTENLTSSEIGELLQGYEGEKATLTLRSESARLRKIVVTRRPIDVPSVEDVHMLDTPGNIGYVRISCFQKTTARELASAIAQLSRRQAKCLVIDLRQNPGGLLQEAINVSDVFLDSGTIVQTYGRNGFHSFQASPSQICSLPLILLVDSNSASAAEIFAGAMQENGRAVVVGTQSYGKGTVQAIVQLSCEVAGKKPIAGLRLTTEKFYSPKGRAYAGVGVTPNVDITHALSVEALGERTPSTGLSQMESTDSEPTFGYIPAAAKRNFSEIDSDLFLSTAVREALKLERSGLFPRTAVQTQSGVPNPGTVAVSR